MLNSTGISLCDDAFGPSADSCGRFDFSLTFEESILSILPSVALILLAPVRLISLQSRPKRVGGRNLQRLKLITIFLFAILQLGLLVLWSLQAKSLTPTSIAAAALSFLDAFIFCLLSYTEHAKSLRPSTLLGAYLFFSLVFDIVRIRTLWLVNYNASIQGVFTAAVSVKAVLLLLEAKEKRRYLNASDRQLGPEETSGIFNQSVFWWLNQLIRQGFRGALSMDDLYPIDEEMSSENLAAAFAIVWKANPEHWKYRLVKVLFKQFKSRTLIPVIPRVALIAFTFCQPLLLNRFLSFLQDSTQSTSIGYALIGAYGIVYFGLAISTGFYWHGVYKWIALIRGSLVSAIYHKTTEISITALDNANAVTLMSSDVERIVLGLRSFHEIWANLVQTFLATYLLERELGLACLAPILTALASVLGIFYISRGASSYQVKWVEAIQKRVGITSTMLSSMKGVKMSGLIEKLTSLIQTLRIAELKAGSQYRLMQTCTAVFAFTPIQISPIITFGIFVAGSGPGHALDTTRMFTSLSLLILLAQPLSQVFQAVPTMLGALACAGRIQAFLIADTKSDHRLLNNVTPEPAFPSSIADDRSRHLRVHDDVELVDFRNSRKSAPESPIESRNVPGLPLAVIRVRDGSFGWSESLGVLNNISFDIPEFRVTMIIGPVASGKTTLLKALLGETPSSKGFVHISTLDISFCDQVPWLLSQSIRKNIIGFASFDVTWYNAVIHACAMDEDLATFPNGDDTMIGSNGISLSGGQRQRVSIARAVYARRRIAIFDDVFSGLDKTTEKWIFEKVFGPRGLLQQLKTTSIIATHAVDLLPSADQIIVLGSDGGILEQGTFDALNASNGYVHGFALNGRDRLDESSAELNTAIATIGQPIVKTITNQEAEDQNRQLGDMSLYKYYFKAVGWKLTSSFLLLCMLFEFAVAFPNIWLKWWSDAASTGDASNGMFLGVYAVLQIGGMACLFVAAIIAYIPMTTVSGAQLHLVTLKTVMAAPMLFFSATDTGVMVNRFSQDMSLIDTELPQALLNFVIGIFATVAEAALISSSSAYITITYPIMIAVLWAVQGYYLRTSRQLRFMDLEAKSPLYTQFLESLNGLATLRAFGWQHDNHVLNAVLLDASQQPFYLLYMIQRWLTLVMDLIGMSLALIVVGLAVKLRSSNTASAGFTGVSLVGIISFTETIKYVVLTWTLLETSIGAVSRVKTFEADTQCENLPGEDQMPPTDWPSHGLVQIKGISASYKDDKKVLNNVSIQIRPGEKIGVCGRSGSGKSTLNLALFRMIELDSGSITVDNYDISKLPRHEVRSRLNAIPQDPYFLAGSIRLNIDPWGKHSDETLRVALQKVELWATILTKGGLDADMDTDFLSHGQKQLFCLARAILRPGKIIVLDEATSSVDRKTDNLMQRVIREEFKRHTIIAVAHRLETILDFDRIIVLDQGVIKECDTPSNLLAVPSIFRDLYETYKSKGGDDMSDDSSIAT